MPGLLPHFLFFRYDTTTNRYRRLFCRLLNHQRLRPASLADLEKQTCRRCLTRYVRDPGERYRIVVSLWCLTTCLADYYRQFHHSDVGIIYPGDEINLQIRLQHNQAFAKSCASTWRESNAARCNLSFTPCHALSSGKACTKITSAPA